MKIELTDEQVSDLGELFRAAHRDLSFEMAVPASGHHLVVCQPRRCDSIPALYCPGRLEGSPGGGRPDSSRCMGRSRHWGSEPVPAPAERTSNVRRVADLPQWLAHAHR